MKQLLKKYRITQSELSRRLNIPLRTVQGWVLGERKPPEYIIMMVEFCIENGADFKKKTVVNQ